MSEKEIYKWFIAHVAYRNESNVKSLLDIAGLEYYMPFKSTIRTWNNVSKEFQVPVIPSCVFVKVEQSDVVMLQMMKEVSLMMNAKNNPLYVSEEQMSDLRQKLETSDNPGGMVLQLIDEIA